MRERFNIEDKSKKIRIWFKSSSRTVREQNETLFAMWLALRRHYETGILPKDQFNYIMQLKKA